MKKVTFMLFIVPVIVAAALMVFKPCTVSGSEDRLFPDPSTTIPDSVFSVFQKSCMDCHSDDGSAMARGKVNFSKWETYDAAKKVKKAGAICEELSDGSMPPKGWKKNNPDDVPSQTEVTRVCNWVKSIK